MCGFIVSRLDGRSNDRFIKRRGPDVASCHAHDGWLFRHYLLQVTGEPMLQPFIDGDVFAIYNGEIYNLPFARSDGENIIPAYREYGAMFPRQLDGEFAIALYDFKFDVAYFVTDRFATKPIWHNGAECASYQSGVGGHKVPANTIEAVRISTGETLYSERYHEWDWDQTVPTYEYCIAAFEQAVAKRYKPGCFIGLSSGYDSGAIACALRGKEFKAYTIVASENFAVIRERVADLWRAADLSGYAAKIETIDDYDVVVDVLTDFDIETQERHLRDNAEEFRYRIRYDDRIDESSYKDDYAAKALSCICMLAHEEGRKVCLSGAGADEILSDYSLIPRQSEFKGTFPDRLAQWSNFTESCMYSYLGKEECVGGSWGIETRYPFLDTEFVQAFLSLTPELKNRNYKAPLYEYLTRERFPFENGRKIGFSVEPLLEARA